MRLAAAALAVLIAVHAVAGPLMGGRRRVTPPAPDVVFRLVVPVATTSTIGAARGQSVTFTRATVRSCFDASGVLQSLTSGQACTTSGALRLEPATTNNLQRSEALDNAYWTKSSGATITADGAAFVDGLTSMDLITTVGSNKVTNRNTSLSGAGPFTMSSWVRAVTGTASAVVAFNCANAHGVANCTCLRSDGGSCTPSTVVSQYCIATATVGTTPVRLSATANCDSGENNIQPNLLPGAWNGTDATAYYGGMMLESGSAPTSYLPTTSATVTRNAETTTVSAADWPTSSGAVKANITLDNSTPPGTAYVFDSRTASSGAGGATIYVDTSRQLNCSTYDGTNTRNAQSSALTWTAGMSYAVRCEWDGAGVQVFRDGVSVGTVTSSSGVPTGHASSAYIGSDTAGANQLRGTVANLVVSNRKAGAQ